MKLSLELIKFELDLPCSNYNFYGAGYNICIDRICFYEENTILEEGCLYLLPEMRMYEKLDKDIFPENSAVILCGENSYKMDKQIPYMYFGSNTNLLKVCNKLNNIIKRYENWRWELQQALDEEDLQQMADCSIPFFRSSLSISDANYHQMVQESHSNYPNGDIPKDTIDFFKSDKLFNEVREKREVFEYPPSIFSASAWCKNIFYNNEYYCRIVVWENIDGPPNIEWMLDFFASYVEKYAVNSNRRSSRQYELHLEDYLRKAIVEEELPHERFKQSLAGFGWYPDHQYILGYVLLSKGDIHYKTADYYCRQFMREYTDMCAFTLEDHMVFILNCHPYHNSVSDFMSSFSYTIREGNFRVGFSNLFQDFSNLKYYYRQAQIAVFSGLQSDSTIWCHYFSEQAMSYILQEASGHLPAEYLCAQELLLLKTYDEENNADYFHTLRTYLDLNMNAVQTAKALYIHHATMVYRLKRLKELINIDFTNTEQILYLQLSFRLLDK